MKFRNEFCTKQADIVCKLSYLHNIEHDLGKYFYKFELYMMYLNLKIEVKSKLKTRYYNEE